MATRLPSRRQRRLPADAVHPRRGRRTGRRRVRDRAGHRRRRADPLRRKGSPATPGDPAGQRLLTARSTMTVNKTTWSPKERQQYEALLAEVVAHSKDTAKRMDLFEKRIAEARKANKTWARDCERAAMREYAASEIKLYQDRIRAMVAHDGRILNVPKVQDRRVRDTSGGVVHQRELIELFTWDQILADRKSTRLNSS